MKFKETEYGDLTGKIYSKNIHCNSRNIVSLEGSPKIVNGNFIFINNNLKTLEYSPLIVTNTFSCKRNKLKSLKGSPSEVYGFYDCSENDLTTLDGCTKKIKGDFDCTKNNKLKNVKDQIIKNQIRAYKYYTDEGDFYFLEIKKEFEEETKKINQKNNQNLSFNF